MKDGLAALITAVCTMVLFSCGTPAHYPLTFPNSKDADDRIVGNWKMVEDTNKNNFYEVTKASAESGYDFQYHVRFFDKGGTNPTYEFNIFFSKYGFRDDKFINVPYYVRSIPYADEWEDKGYFFVRVLEANNDFSKITTTTVNDPELPNLKSAMELHRYFTRHMDEQQFYSDTVHFYKVNQSTEKLRQPRAVVK